MTFEENLKAFADKEPVKVRLVEDERRDLSLKISSIPRSTITTEIPVADFEFYNTMYLKPDHQSGYDSALLEIQDILGYHPGDSTRGGTLRFFAPEGKLKLFEDGSLNPRAAVSLCSKIMSILEKIDHRTPEKGKVAVSEAGISELTPEMITKYQEEIGSNPKYR